MTRIVLAYALGLVALVLLAACGSAPKPPPEIREVLVPIAQPCDASVRRPALPDTPDAVRAQPNAFEKTRLLLAGRTLRDAYIASLEAGFIACGGTIHPSP